MSNSLPCMLQFHSPRGAIFRDVVVLYPLHYLDDTSLVVGELDYRASSLCSLSERNLCVTSVIVVLVASRCKTQCLQDLSWFSRRHKLVPKFPQYKVNRPPASLDAFYRRRSPVTLKRPLGKLPRAGGGPGLAHMRCVHGSWVRRVVTEDLWASAHFASPHSRKMEG